MDLISRWFCLNSSSLSSSIVLRSSFCFLSASVRRSAIAVCARVSAAFFSDTSSCNRAMVLCATAVTCATADSSPRDPGAPMPSRPPADAAMCASSRLRIASRSFSAFLAEAIACETSRSNVAHLLSASAARTFNDRIASICARTIRWVSTDAVPGCTPTAAAAPTAARASAFALRRGAGIVSELAEDDPSTNVGFLASMSSRCRARTCRCRSSARTSPACALVSVASSILRTCSSRSASRASRKRSLSSAAALARCVRAAVSLDWRSSSLRERISRRGASTSPPALAASAVLVYFWRLVSSNSALSARSAASLTVACAFARSSSRRAAPLRRSLSARSHFSASAASMRPASAASARASAASCACSKFLASSRKPNSLESCTCSRRWSRRQSPCSRSASASATCFSCLSCAVDDLSRTLSSLARASAAAASDRRSISRTAERSEASSASRAALVAARLPSSVSAWARAFSALITSDLSLAASSSAATTASISARCLSSLTHRESFCRCDRSASLDSWS
mmetsp:Transcript_3664/g.16787  ORF Transcript_3664/g.16787 Transcript_3664/m.16787 type:complete len:518 (+) Transcript_3664:2294-3847(+)